MAATGVDSPSGGSAAERVIDTPPQIPWRDARAGAGWGFAAVSAILLAFVAMALGSWWTAHAVVDGDPAGTLLRFVLSAVAATYYMTLFRTARRQMTR